MLLNSSTIFMTLTALLWRTFIRLPRFLGSSSGPRPWKALGPVCDHVPTCNQWSPSASPMFLCQGESLFSVTSATFWNHQEHAVAVTGLWPLVEFYSIGLLTVLLCSSHIRLFTFSLVTVNSLYRFGSESHTFEQILNKTADWPGPLCLRGSTWIPLEPGDQPLLSLFTACCTSQSMTVYSSSWLLLVLETL